MTQREKREWEEEGMLENMLGCKIDLLYYIDRTHGVFHYILLLEGMHSGERRLVTSSEDDCRILDGIKEQWTLAQTAKALDDIFAQFAFTWRGLRLLFPDLPEEPLNDSTV